ncbi:MAG: hypothetical protein EOO13_16270 [Chitinophagaceae bacterium]|nr:MAG: hypothetical protein EOO13_16270 [Chitinophagaceae bacterium]
MESLTSNEHIMAEIHYIKGSININTNAGKIWEALTNARHIKNYMGTNVKTDWNKGSDIIWEGEHGGISYQDKGKVLENDTDKTLRYSYWSSGAGTEDSPDNRSIITWSLENSMDGLTTLTYQRENIATLEERAMFEEQLPSMLDEIKKLAEGNMD